MTVAKMLDQFEDDVRVAVLDVSREKPPLALREVRSKDSLILGFIPCRHEGCCNGGFNLDEVAEQVRRRDAGGGLSSRIARLRCKGRIHKNGKPQEHCYESIEIQMEGKLRPTSAPTGPANPAS